MAVKYRKSTKSTVVLSVTLKLITLTLTLSLCSYALHIALILIGFDFHKEMYEQFMFRNQDTKITGERMAHCPHCHESFCSHFGLKSKNEGPQPK